jgi:hypothetical protein
MSVVPSMSNACIVQDHSVTSPGIILVGVQDLVFLRAYRINLSFPSSPTATIFLNQTSDYFRQPTQKSCHQFVESNIPSSNRSWVLQQYGTFTSYSIQIYPNGTTNNSGYYKSVAFISPKFYSQVGTSSDFNWYIGLTNQTGTSGSNWVGVRENGTDINSNYIK